LDQIEGPDLPLVGGKAFRLATLKQNGLQVPPGVVLTTTFFETHLKQSKLTPLWMGSPDVAVTGEALTWLADSLKTKPIGRDLAQALRQTLDATFAPSLDKFAVRSSAIDEDQRDHTFAGIHLTELGVPRHALTIAITRCWASALSGPALAYRQVHGMSIQGIRLAVLIQPMLSPASSGVGFTMNPVSGDREELIIEATWGLGEAVVGGSIQPYFYRLANRPPTYPLLEYRPGNVPAPPAQAQAEPLPPQLLPELALHLARIQALMGETQDVEWAWQDERFFFLQTRPVSRPAKPAQPLDLEWSRGSHPEYLPELPSPFFSALLSRSQCQAITFFRELGLAVDDLGPYLKLILGRPYLNLTFLKRIIAQVGLAPGQLLYTIGHTESGGTGRPLSIDWEMAFKAWRVYWGILRRFFSNGRLVRAYQALVDEAVEIFEQTGLEQEPVQLLSQFRQHNRLYEALFEVNLGLASTLSAVTAIGSSLLGRMPQNPATLLTALAQQRVKSSEAELSKALARLGHLARADGPTRRYLEQAGPDFSDFADNPALSAAFRAGFAELLAKFGDRATYEADPGWPRYREEPAALLAIIGQHVRLEAGPEHPTLNWATLTGPASGLNRLLPWRQGLAWPFVRLMAQLLRLRDQLNSGRAKVLAAGRRWNLALGRKWVEAGWLAQPADIFWLTLDEVERTLMTGPTMGLTLPAVVQARKETYQSWKSLPSS
jgi:pyruvate,water dikinase